MEEQFFFLYHLKTGRNEFREYPIHERKWVLARFLSQKEKEHDAMEAAKRKKKY